MMFRLHATLLSFTCISRLVSAMTSLIDSTAQFESRLREAGFPANFIDQVKLHGVTTLGQLAFALGQPGQPIQDNAVDGFIQAATLRASTILEVTNLKRIAFEAQTYLIASLRQSVERPEDSPKKIAHAERAARLDQLRRLLTGVSITGELEPAHCVLEKFCHMFDTNTVKYWEPAACISRPFEIAGGSKNKELTLEKGSLVVKSSEEKLTSSTDTEIKVHYAMVRRALALQFAQLMSFDQHGRWEQFLFESLHREPPPGFNRPSLGQILQCDKAAWQRLGTTVNEVRQRRDGTYPLGEALLALMHDPNITLFLMPVAKAASSSTSSPWRNQTQNRSEPYVQNTNPGKGRGKSKSKKGGRGTPPIPTELRGKWHRTGSGEPLCFGFNCATGCNDKSVQPGQRCARGWHLCAEPKCQRPHSLQQHSKDAGS